MFQGRIIEYTFFFCALVVVGYIVWQIFAPFITALSLAAIIVIICYPLYNTLLRFVSRGNRSIAAFLSALIVLCAIVIPLALASSVLVNEFMAAYRSMETGGQLPIDTFAADIEKEVQVYVPNFELNITEQIKESAGWFTHNLGSIFAGTVSIIFSFFIALLGCFYLFRDGPKLVNWGISISPLKDVEDQVIMSRLAQSIRSVATGTILVAILQGILAATGFAIFGIERPILWGTFAALGALLPGIGTFAIMIPGILYLFYVDEAMAAIGLSIWTLATVVVVDNFVSPHLMSRGNDLHPFVVLLSVIGGLTLFGPIGFILGPVMVSLFLVLIELYGQYVTKDIVAKGVVPTAVSEPMAKEKSKKATAKKISSKKDVKAHVVPVVKETSVVKKSVVKKKDLTVSNNALEIKKLVKAPKRTAKSKLTTV